MAKIALFLANMLVFTACVTTSPSTPEFSESRVIERIGNLDETPSWAEGGKTHEQNEGDMIYIMTATMEGNARPEACTNAASDLARSQILREIKDNLTASGQIAELSADSDPAVESLLAFLSQGKLSGVKVKERYWEKREESNSQGMRVLRLKCAAKVAISRSSLEKQLQLAINGGKGEGNAEIRERLLNAQKDFIERVGSESN